MRTGRFVWAFASVGMAGVAMADPLPMNHGVGMGPSAWRGGMDDEIGAILPNDHASVGIAAYSGPGSFIYLNSGGEVPVKRTVGWTEIGTTLSGQDVIEAQWDEFLGTTTNVVQLIYRTVNGDEMLPAGTQVGGMPAPFLGWRLGATDPVSTRPKVTALNLVSMKVFASSDGGKTFDVVDLTSTFPPVWDGTDVGRTLPLGGLGINYLITEYEYEVERVPAPSGAAVMCLAGLCFSRRRRR